MSVETPDHDEKAPPPPSDPKLYLALLGREQAEASAIRPDYVLESVRDILQIVKRET